MRTSLQRLMTRAAPVAPLGSPVPLIGDLLADRVVAKVIWRGPQQAGSRAIWRRDACAGTLPGELS